MPLQIVQKLDAHVWKSDAMSLQSGSCYTIDKFLGYSHEMKPFEYANTQTFGWLYEDDSRACAVQSKTFGLSMFVARW